MLSMKMYLVVWISGLLAGLIIVERWRRTGRGFLPVAQRAGEAVDTATPGSASRVALDQPALTTSILAGAKADALRARQLLERATPWTTTSAPTFRQLRRSSRATAGDAPNQSA
jgi:hypothetical protein